MAWAGLYLGSPGTRTPFDKLLETADHAIDAPTFSEWLQRSDTEPSVHIAVWFAKFGILGRSPAPVVTDSASTTPDRRLARLRELGGNATYERGAWKITGISALVHQHASLET